VTVGEEGQLAIKTSKHDEYSTVFGGQQLARREAEKMRSEAGGLCVCPKGHCLQQFQTTHARYTCDGGDGCPDKGSQYPVGTTLNGCRICNFDFCSQCIIPEERSKREAEEEPPQDWRSTSTADGKTYYFNKKTKETQWEKPVGVVITPSRQEKAKREAEERAVDAGTVAVHPIGATPPY
jgi:hypothetical protein